MKDLSQSSSFFYRGATEMSDEDKNADELKKQGFGQVSRRSFLKDAGLMVGAPAIGTMAANASQAPPQPKAGAVGSKGASATGTTQLSPAATSIEITVNGGKYKFVVEPNWTLRQVLRDEIGFTSPKDWCGGLGACGSCTVIMNGRPILSCLTLACECNGAKVETAEGIAKAKHPILQAYINNNAFQCGYCTPGFVCTAKALLDRNSNPTEADVRDALGGNLCRCATYQRHPPAVLEAAKNLKRA
jgi:aerobic-type carbon monoxide dehydrogenase small subunit (CoxS/CutS family)